MDNLSANESKVTAEVGGGESAFDMFMGGASIEEINDKFFSDVPDEGEAATVLSGETSNITDSTENADEDNASEIRDDDAENDDASSSDSQAEENTGDEANTDEGAVADNVQSDNPGERRFTQAEVDAIARRARVKEKGAHDRLKSEYDDFQTDVARLLGVDASDVRNTLKTELIKRRAEAEGVDDVDLFVRVVNAEDRAENAENELENLKRQKQEDARKAYVDKFLDDVTSQLDVFAKENPDVDIEAFSKRKDFNNVLKTLYITDETKDSCVAKAFEVFGVSKKAVPSHDEVKAEISKKSVDANRQRASETASSSKAISKTEVLDYSKLSPKDFLELGKRASRGEIIIP